MTDKDEAARQKAKALARWEGEGGALARPDAALLRSRARRDLSKTPQACTSGGCPAHQACDRTFHEGAQG